MTTTINLLPWREERRKQQQQEFIVLLVVAAVVGGLLFWLWQGSVDQQIADQTSAPGTVTFRPRPPSWTRKSRKSRSSKSAGQSWWLAWR